MLTILDGGMGRELKHMGAPFKQPEWSAQALMEAPEMVLQAHQNFVQAGADVITTNNYAVVPFHIGDERFARDAQTLTSLAGKLAREAAASAVRVAGSLPPLSGSYRPDWFNAELAATAYPGIIAALDPYVDLWVAETMSSIEEASSVATALAGQSKPVWLSFTLKDDPEAAVPCLRSEESLDSALALAGDSQADALLFNCSIPEVIGKALDYIGHQRDQHYPALRTGGYANAFTPRNAEVKANTGLSDMRDDISSERYAEIARQWHNSGATIIGGCCGIGPEHIQAIAEKLAR